MDRRYMTRETAHDSLDLVREAHSLSALRLARDERTQSFEALDGGAGHYITPKSPKDFSKRDVEQHLASLYCYHQFCYAKPFRREVDLRRHYKNDHEPPESKIQHYWCDYQSCLGRSEAFHRRERFRDHLCDFHKEAIERDERLIPAENGEEYSGWWRCFKCFTRNAWVSWSCAQCSQDAADTKKTGGGPKHTKTKQDDATSKAPEIRLLDTKGSTVSTSPDVESGAIAQRTGRGSNGRENAASGFEWLQGVSSLLSKIDETEDDRLTPSRLRFGSSAVSSLAASSCDESMSICSTQDIDIDQHIPESLRSQALFVLLNAFARSRGAFSFTEYADNTTNHATGGPSDRTLQTPTTQRSRRSSNEQSKRKRSGDDDHNNGEGSGRRRNPKSKANGPGGEGKLLACPYYKWKPLSYKSCRSKQLYEIHRLKTHLKRCHRPPIHCVICFTEFTKEGDRDDHYRQRLCERQPTKVFAECMYPELEERVMRRVDQRLSQKEQWNELYKVLFPDSQVPASPYLCDGLISDELSALQEFMAQQWPAEYRRFVAPGLPADLVGREDVLQAFTTNLFEQAVERILQRAEQRRENIPVSDSEESSFVSVALPPLGQTISASSSANISDQPLPQQVTMQLASNEVAETSDEIDRMMDYGDFEYYLAHCGTGTGQQAPFDPLVQDLDDV